MKLARGLAAALLVARVAGAEEALPPAPEPAPGPEATPSPEAGLPDASALARRAEEVLRGDGSRIDATMTILSRRARRSRVVRLRVFDDRRADRALVRVLAPEEQTGTALLKRPPNLWITSPKEPTPTRLLAAQWREPFLGSEFSRDDLVRGSCATEGYEHRILELDPRAGEAGDLRAWVLESSRRPGAEAAWERIVAWIEVEHATPLRVDWYGAGGVLARTLRLDDLREVQGRRFPHRWVMRRPEGEGRETRIEVDAIRFDPQFEEGLFTTRGLARGPR